MSQAPVLSPLVPLAEFVRGTGLPPPLDSFHVYLRRMKEQGFDVTPLLEQAARCGIPVQPEVSLQDVSQGCKGPVVVQAMQ